ncbi:MAG: APC family permease [Clostridia bacterium]|nr:APC family permease [Clostridia bacterium]MCL6521820.1 APC family permease [Bacillota bacterium]
MAGFSAARGEAAGEPALRRVLRLRTVVSSSAGITFATSSFIAAAQVAASVGGDAAGWPVLLAGALTFLVAQSFAELNGMMPSAAAIRLYFRRAFRDDLALALSTLYMFVMILVLAAEAYVLAESLRVVLPGVPAAVWIVGLLLVALAANVRGLEIAGGLQDAITYGLVLSLFALAVLALGRVHFALPGLLHPGGAARLAQGTALGVFLFVGFEWVTPLAEEVTDDALIARGMSLAVLLLALVYAAVTTAMGHFLDAAELAAPAPQMRFALKALGGLGGLWMVAVSLAATGSTFNAGLTAASRFLYATAREGSLPGWLAAVHPRYFTPRNALLLLFALVLVASLLVTATAGFAAIVDTAAALEGVVYALASLAVIRLRRKEPETRRPYRAWGVPWLPALTGLLFAGLGVVAALTAGWPALLILGGGFALSGWYAGRLAPRLREAARQRRARARAARELPR